MSIEKTKFDSCFTEKSKEIGYWYYVNNKVTNLTKKGNIYSALVDEYTVRIEYSNNRKEELDDYDCECSFHNNQDNFCPHVYALVCSSFNVTKNASKFSINYLEKYRKLSKEKIKQKFIKQELDIIDLDILGYDYEELFPDSNNSSLINKLENYIESMPIEVLNDARTKTIEDGGDTSILDKAINNKSKKKEQAEKNKTGTIFGIFCGLFNRKSNDKKSLNDQIESHRNDYEPYQFEEEELEEDDYYYEDEV